MIGVYAFIAANGEDLRDLMKKADDKVGKIELLYLGEFQSDTEFPVDLHHYLSSTILVSSDKEQSRIAIAVNSEELEKTREGLEKKIGVKLI